MEERTLVIIKPDGVKKHLVGETLKRFESRGLKIIALQMIWPTKEQMDLHYPKDKEWIAGLGKNTIRSYKEFEVATTLKEDFGTEDPYKIGLKVREWLIDYMTSDPIIKMVIEGNSTPNYSYPHIRCGYNGYYFKPPSTYCSFS